MPPPMPGPGYPGGAGGHTARYGCGGPRKKRSLLMSRDRLSPDRQCRELVYSSTQRAHPGLPLPHKGHSTPLWDSGKPPRCMWPWHKSSPLSPDGCVVPAALPGPTAPHLGWGHTSSVVSKLKGKDRHHQSPPAMGHRSASIWDLSPLSHVCPQHRDHAHFPQNAIPPPDPKCHPVPLMTPPTSGATVPHPAPCTPKAQACGFHC